VSYMILCNAPVGVLAYPAVSGKPSVDEEEEAQQVYENLLKPSGEDGVMREHALRVNGREYKLITLKLEPSEEREEAGVNAVKQIVSQLLKV